MAFKLAFRGVHCTHGFNRTGFLIIAYMIEQRKCRLDAAVQRFAEARPPGIYREEYLEELFVRYGKEGDTLPVAPSFPEWHEDIRHRNLRRRGRRN